MDRFSRNTQVTNWIKVAKKKMTDNLNYFSDNEESEWQTNIDSSILDKPSKETQLHDSEISSFIEANRNSNTTKKTNSVLLCILLSRIPRK